LRAGAGKADLAKLVKDAKCKYVKVGPFARKRWSYYGPGLMTSFVPEVGRDTKFLARAFALAPIDPDDHTSPGPAGVMMLYRARKVLLMQRISYEAPTEQEFQAMAMDLTMPMLLRERHQRGLLTWFALDNIKDRVAFVPKVD
ncbi:hypothetical protein LCGC14_1921270, partial [marine sediment metagenome]